MQHLTGKVALVTGAAKRIGKEIALTLAKEGCHIVVHYNTSQRDAEITAREIREYGVQAWIVQADFSELEQAEQVFPGVLKNVGPIDILINSASIFPQNRVTDFTLHDFAENMTTNALSPLWLSRAFASQGREGAILNILDTRILDYDQHHAAYHLSKRTLYTITRMLSLEFAPDIRVNAIAPGVILPPPGEDASYLQQMAPTNPLQRAGTLRDLTDTVLFLLQSSFITGQVIYVDGGRHLKGTVYGS